MYDLNSPNQRSSSINHFANQNPHLSYFGGAGGSDLNSTDSVLNNSTKELVTTSTTKNNSNSKYSVNYYILNQRQLKTAEYYN